MLLKSKTPGRWSAKKAAICWKCIINKQLSTQWALAKVQGPDYDFVTMHG